MVAEVLRLTAQARHLCHRVATSCGDTVRYSQRAVPYLDKMACDLLAVGLGGGGHGVAPRWLPPSGAVAATPPAIFEAVPWPQRHPLASRRSHPLLRA